MHDTINFLESFGENSVLAKKIFDLEIDLSITHTEWELEYEKAKNKRDSYFVLYLFLFITSPILALVSIVSSSLFVIPCIICTLFLLFIHFYFFKKEIILSRKQRRIEKEIIRNVSGNLNNTTWKEVKKFIYS